MTIKTQYSAILLKLICITPKSWKETLVSHCRVSLFYVFFSVFSDPYVGLLL